MQLSEETAVIAPTVEKLLLDKGIPFVREMTFDLLDETGKRVLSGRADFVFRDPRSGMLVMPETKGLDLDSLTENQKVYVPLFESGKGALIRITSRRGGAINLPAGSVERIAGYNVLRVGRKNIKDFASALEEISTGDRIRFSFRDASGLRFFKSEEEFDTFLATKGMSRLVGAPRASAVAKIAGAEGTPSTASQMRTTDLATQHVGEPLTTRLLPDKAPAALSEEELPVENPAVPRTAPRPLGTTASTAEGAGEVGLRSAKSVVAGERAGLIRAEDEMEEGRMLEDPEAEGGLGESEGPDAVEGVAHAMLSRDLMSTAEKAHAELLNIAAQKARETALRKTAPLARAVAGIVPSALRFGSNLTLRAHETFLGGFLGTYAGVGDVPDEEATVEIVSFSIDTTRRPVKSTEPDRDEGLTKTTHDVEWTEAIPLTGRSARGGSHRSPH